jgi:hypothetical protein
MSVTSQQASVSDPGEEAGVVGRVIGSFRRPPGEFLRIVGLWAAWLAIVCTFQVVVQARLAPERPDYTLGWTQYETGQLVLDCRPMLDDSNMNEHVAFDSEYYLSIAQAGYDDPNASAFADLGFGQRWQGVPSCSPGAPADWTSLNYAFLPGYPMAMRPIMAVENVLPFTSDLTDTGKATLAGIVVSALGGLLAMLALARLTGSWARRRGETGPEAGPWGGLGGLRAAFYLLIFPTGFYLAQVYTEGLFVGLAFMACALSVERKILAAAVFAALATWVRPVGIFLVLPLAWAAFEVVRDRWPSVLGPDRKANAWLGASLLSVLAPLAAFVAWYVSPLGESFRQVEDSFFSRRFDLVGSFNAWVDVWNSLVTGVDKTGNSSGYAVFGGGSLASSSTVYITLEFIAVALALVASVWLFRRMPGVALFGMGVLLLSFGSSAVAPQGMIRYVLAVPAIFLMLAWLGRRAVFDRVWVLASTLLMGMLVMLFTFGFWVS